MEDLSAGARAGAGRARRDASRSSAATSSRSPGPSGSGKTTLLNLLGGLTHATRGHVWIDGREITGLSDRELTHLRLERIGYVFQAYNLLPVLSALENAEFTLLLRGVPEAERRRRVRELFETHRDVGPRGPPARQALGRPAAARGGGARGRRTAGARAGRRAHGQSRLGDERRAARRDGAAQPRGGHDVRVLHARPARDGSRAPADPPRGRRRSQRRRRAVRVPAWAAVRLRWRRLRGLRVWRGRASARRRRPSLRLLPERRRRHRGGRRDRRRRARRAARARRCGRRRAGPWSLDVAYEHTLWWRDAPIDRRGQRACSSSARAGGDWLRPRLDAHDGESRELAASVRPAEPVATPRGR